MTNIRLSRRSVRWPLLFFFSFTSDISPLSPPPTAANTMSFLAFVHSACGSTLHTFQVSGGSFSSPFYGITPPLVEFTRGDTYRFEAAGVTTFHPFKVGGVYLAPLSSYYNCDGCGSPLIGSSGAFEFTIPIDASETSLTYYCTVPSHNMKLQVALRDATPSPSPSPPPSPSPSSPPPSPPTEPLLPSPPHEQCDRVADFIIVGSGAGGTPAAAMMRKLGAEFLWFEAGADESDRLRNFAYTDPRHMPSQNWEPDERPLLRRADGTVMPYAIPRAAGGQTSHYGGVNYWTLSDTMASTEMSPNEMEVLEFVKNTTLGTGVVCDQYDPRYHTHSRTRMHPNTEDELSSTNACMYGRCNGTACATNKLFVSAYSVDTEKGAVADWQKGSTVTEFGADGLETRTEAQRLVVQGRRVLGVDVRSEEFGEYRACARKSVLLAAGVMGDASLLLPHMTQYEVFGQPYVVHMDYELLGFTASPARCDPDSVSGGVLIKLPRNGSGFMSTLGLCQKDGDTRILWGTPLAVNEKVQGVVRRAADGRIVADMNYDDSILATLTQDFQSTVRTLYGKEVNMDGLSFSDGGYHWTGGHDLSVRSRVKRFDNLYLADALSVTGPTSGWTSWNTRVAGALAAFRAVRSTSQRCAQTQQSYIDLTCCDEASGPTCANIKDQYQSEKCCNPIFEDFCERYHNTCVVPGYSTEYSDCLSFVNKLDDGQDGDATGDTVQCRLTHLGLAEQGAEQAQLHCPHASKAGDGYCSTKFCRDYFNTCVQPGHSPAFADCTADVGRKNEGVASGESSDYSGDTQLCRRLHLDVAMGGADVQLHCGHASPGGADACSTEFCRDYYATCVEPGHSPAFADCALDMESREPGVESGDSSDYKGDTRLCRRLHLSVAMTADPHIHCRHASLSGGDSCTSEFCADYEKVCVEPGHSLAYGDCAEEVARMPAGNDNSTDKYAEHTALCRSLHLDVAKGADPEVHCLHSSPSGGDSCTVEFCRQYETRCVKPGHSAPYDNCVRAFLEMPPGTVGDLYGNTRSCREAHMEFISQSDEQAAIHCPHVSSDGAEYCA